MLFKSCYEDYSMSGRTHRREFSNDPTVEISTLAETFQRIIANVQKDLEVVHSKTSQHVIFLLISISIISC